MKKSKISLCIFLTLMIAITSFFIIHPEKVAADNIAFRAVWVASVYNLDYPKKATTDANTLKSQADGILDECKKMGLNAVILQVRPSADALYKSDIFPWSKYLTGSVGTAPADNFDPLAYWITEAHKRGIELHAWINPYRITKGKDAEFAKLPDTHPAKVHPDWVVKYTDGNYYFNPGIPEVRKLIESGAAEIARNYDVDGIHMDDYFYPGTDFDDAATYATYGQAFGNIGDFRRDSVNLLVKDLNEQLHAIKPDLSFGVSPAGIWANASSVQGGSNTNGGESYTQHYADSKEWVKEGWIDYICPQIYWYIGHPTADYETLVNWWTNVVSGTEVKLYIGMADYQAGNTDQTSPWYGIDAIQKEVSLNRTIPQVNGEVHYAYHTLFANQPLIDFYQTTYQQSTKIEVPLITDWLLNKKEHHAYMQGSDNMFRPDDGLTRAEAATIFANLLVDSQDKALFDSKEVNYGSFYDVSPTAWYSRAVELMKQCNIVSGYSDGSFQPNKKVTRAEFVTMAYLADKVTEKASANFVDIPQNYWALSYIGFGEKSGWVNGYEDGTFRPNETVTRAEVATIMNKILDRTPDNDFIDNHAEDLSSYIDVPPFHWAYYNIVEASISHEYTKQDGVESWK